MAAFSAQLNRPWIVTKLLPVITQRGASVFPSQFSKRWQRYELPLARVSRRVWRATGCSLTKTCLQLTLSLTRVFFLSLSFFFRLTVIILVNNSNKHNSNLRKLILHEHTHANMYLSKIEETRNTHTRARAHTYTVRHTRAKEYNPRV